MRSKATSASSGAPSSISLIAAVDRYSGKGVHATVAQILVEDATSLKGSCSLKK